MSDVPAYDDLPVHAELGLPHAWDVLDPTRGSLAFIGAEERVRAAAEVRDGESIALNLPLDLLDPPLFGRARLEHQVIEVGKNTLEDVLDGFNPQASSQWDGLAHVRARQFGFFGGETEIDGARAAMGIENWARTGIVGRGVLLDVAAWAEQQGRAIDPFGGDEITASDLAQCAREQDVTLMPGDIVCIRTGWVSAYRQLDAAGRSRADLGAAFAGLRADADMARFVWDNRLGAITADNPALECAPGDAAVGSLHRRLIPLLGTAVAELLDLDLLAQRCAANRRWTFMFVAVPLPLTGGVSSPSNALAVL